MNNAPATFLPWDTEHFGCRIARANIRQLDAANWRRLEGWCREQSIDCLYFLASAADQNTIFELQRQRFDFLDIRMTLEKKLQSPQPKPADENFLFREAHEKDAPRLLEMSRDKFNFTRFYADRCFDDGLAARMYEIWLNKSLTMGFADRVLVAEFENQVVGYAVCHLNRPPGEGNIGLLLIGESVQGRGLGGKMFQYAAHWLAAQGMRKVNIIVQGKQIPIQRMYQRRGMVTRSVELWYHKWFIKCPQEA